MQYEWKLIGEGARVIVVAALVVAGTAFIKADLGAITDWGAWGQGVGLAAAQAAVAAFLALITGGPSFSLK